LQRNKFFRSGAKNGSFFCEGLVCVLGKTKCAICAVGQKLFLKNLRWQKNGVGQRVGFLAVR